MIASSRPLRFVVLLLGGWVAMRTVQLWPVPSEPVELVPALLGVIAPSAEAQPSFEEVVRAERPALPERERPSPVLGARTRLPTIITRERRAMRFALTGPAIGPVNFASAAGPIGSPLAPVPAADPPRRLRASAWAIARSGGGAVSPFAPQLGGSQAGMRVTYAIDDARRFALAGRLSTALASRQREAAVGIDWQPSALPIHLVAEQRIAIESARGGPSVGVIAGVGPAPVAAGFRLEAYGQAGGIARDGGVEGYADGALRVARPVATVGTAALDLGLGAWGGVQRGAARLDFGPSASASVPVGGTAIRFSLDWRQRVIGDARPGSGPTFSIGTDF